MIDTPVHQDPKTVVHATAALSELSASCSSLVYATIVSEDGFSVAQLAVTDHDRMASMSSSMQAIADAVAHELHIGSSDYIVIASKLGNVLQLRVPMQSLVLSSLFGPSETLGKVLSASRQCVAQLHADIQATSRPQLD